MTSPKGGGGLSGNLDPEIKKILLQKYTPNFAGEVSAINAVASVAGCNPIKAYSPNFKGVIEAILNLGWCIGELKGQGGGADLCCLLPPSPHQPWASAGIKGPCNYENCDGFPGEGGGSGGGSGGNGSGGGTDVGCHTDNPCREYPEGGVECLSPLEQPRWHNGGICNPHAGSTDLPVSVLLPIEKKDWRNAGTVGNGCPDVMHWVDHLWPCLGVWANAGWTDNNCDSSSCDVLCPEGKDFNGCSTCCSECRGGVENYKPQLSFTWNNAGLDGSTCPSAWAKPTCLLPGDDWVGNWMNSGVVGNGDPETDDYVQYLRPGCCVWDNSGFLGDPCEINGDEWMDANGWPAPEECASYTPFRTTWSNAGVVGGEYQCDIHKLPKVCEHWFTSEHMVWRNAKVTPRCEPLVSNELPETPECIDGQIQAPGCEPDEPDQELGFRCDFTCKGYLPNGYSDIDAEWARFNNSGLVTSRDCECSEPCPEDKVPPVFISDQPPADPCTGTLWFDPNRLEMRIWFCDANTCQWAPVYLDTGTAREQGAIVSDSPPSCPVNGTLWFDSERMEMRTWYSDPSTQQWVPTSLASANSPETENLKREVAVLRSEIEELKMALTGLLGK